MPSPKHQRKTGSDKNKSRRLSEKASSFHGKAELAAAAASIPPPRPRTLPDLFAGRGSSWSSAEVAATAPPKLTKLLLNVTIQRSLGAVKTVLPPEATVEDLIAAALQQYAREQRLPVLPSYDASDFDLHYSQFSLESLDRIEKLVALGSRNFFLCPARRAAEAVAPAAESGGTQTASASRCWEEADKGSKKGSPWLKFMDFLL